MCEYFVNAGAQVAVVDVNAEHGEQAVAKLKGLGADAKFFQGDVSKKDSMEKMCADVLSAFGKIDILVNNAGVNVGPDGRKPIQDFAEEHWHRIIDIDLSGVYYCSGPIIKHMAERKYGKIVNVASIGGLVPLRNQCAFAAAKAGVINLTKAMAIELAPDGILVNGICPGSIMMPGTSDLFYGDKAVADRMLSHIPLGRPGKPQEIAGATIFLSSDEASYMTGNIVTIDGGWTCGFARDF